MEGTRPYRRRGRRLLGPRLCGVVMLAALATGLPVAASGAGERGRGLDIRLTRGGSAVRVKMLDDRFRPSTITISASTRVKWVNRGDELHSTTSSGSWDSGLLEPGESFSRRFRREGTFSYFCTVHPDMRGTVNVT